MKHNLCFNDLNHSTRATDSILSLIMRIKRNHRNLSTIAVPISYCLLWRCFLIDACLSYRLIVVHVVTESHCHQKTFLYWHFVIWEPCPIGCGHFWFTKSASKSSSNWSFVIHVIKHGPTTSQLRTSLFRGINRWSIHQLIVFS